MARATPEGAPLGSWHVGCFAPGMLEPSGTVSSRNAKRVLQFGVSRGLAPGAASEGLEDPTTTRIPIRRMYAIWSHLGRGLRAAGLPIQLAQEMRLEDLDLLGFVVLTAPTALHALESFVDYGALLNNHSRWRLRLSARTVELHLESALPRSLGVRLSHETAAAQAVQGVRQLCGESLDPLSVSFRHAAPGDTRDHRALFRCPVKFDAPGDQLVFARAPFEGAPRGANRALWAYLRSQADLALRELAPRPLAARAADEVLRGLASGATPDIASVASELGTTERTLRRALAAAGTTFRRVLDEARRERARSLLQEGSLSVTRAAFEAGFSDVSAFSHACRRWFGRPPRELSKAERG